MTSHTQRMSLVLLTLCCFVFDSSAKEDSVSSQLNPLYLAISHNDIDETARLLTSTPLPLDAYFSDGTTPIYAATKSNNAVMVTMLLEAGFNPNLAAKSRETPLMVAIMANNLEIVNNLISAGADVNMLDASNRNALHFALRNYDVQPFSGSALVSLLLQAGANPNQPNNVGATPTYFAATNGRTSELSLLIQAKADVNLAEDEGWTPLLAAANDQNIEMVDMLIDAKANVNYALQGGWTALLLCINNKTGQNGPAIIDLLIDHGANVNLANASGTTPILLAALNGKLDEYKSLLKGNPNLNASRVDGKNLLHLAVISGNINLAVNVLKHPFDMNKKDGKGRAAIHYVVQKDPKTPDLTPILGMLIDEGADVSLPTDDGYTPLMIAAHFNRINEARLLIESGADLLAENPQENHSTAQDYAYLARNLDIAVMIGKAVRGVK